MANPDSNAHGGEKSNGFFSKFVSALTSPFKDTTEAASSSMSPSIDGKKHRSNSMKETPRTPIRIPPPTPQSDSRQRRNPSATSDNLLEVLALQLGAPERESRGPGSSVGAGRPRSASTQKGSTAPSTPTTKPSPSKPFQLRDKRMVDPPSKRNLHTKVSPVDNDTPYWTMPETVCDGLLQKLNKGRTKWSLRWFGIFPHQPQILYWYTKEPTGPTDEPVGAMKLDIAHVRKSRLLLSVGSQSAELLFEIITAAEIYYLSCASEDDLTNWCAFLQPRTHTYTENLMLDDFELRIHHSTEGQFDDLIHSYQQRELAIVSKPLTNRLSSGSPSLLPFSKSSYSSSLSSYSPMSPLLLSTSPLDLHSTAAALIQPTQPLSNPVRLVLRPFETSSSNSSLSEEESPPEPPSDPSLTTSPSPDFAAFGPAVLISGSSSTTSLSPTMARFNSRELISGPSPSASSFDSRELITASELSQLNEALAFPNNNDPIISTPNLFRSDVIESPPAAHAYDRGLNLPSFLKSLEQPLESPQETRNQSTSSLSSHLPSRANSAPAIAIAPPEFRFL